LSFVAAIALAETLEHYIDPDLIKIKWPNDVLVDGKKIAGILLESGTTNDTLWVIIGMGVNLTHHPDNTVTPATHLLEHIDDLNMTGPEPIYTGSQPVLALLAARFDFWLDLYLNSGFFPVREAWIDRAMGMGEPVLVNLPNEVLSGTAQGLDEDGALLLRLENGEIQKIHAGDVFFSSTTL
jgi:BirA family biotin operon repressor/biotin-[acetyl-CoA-carboxylase] ligase